MSQVQERHSPRQIHRQEVRNQIVLPMLGVVALLILAVLLIFAPLSPTRFSAVSDFVLTIYMLCPTVLCCLIPFGILAAAAVGLWAGNDRLAPPLRRLRTRVVGELRRVQTVVPRAAGPVVRMESKLAYWERFLGARPGRADSTSDSEKD